MPKGRKFTKEAAAKAAGAGKRRPATLGSTGAALIKTSTEAAAAGAA
jgi:hypothetical protein